MVPIVAQFLDGLHMSQISWRGGAQACLLNMRMLDVLGFQLIPVFIFSLSFPIIEQASRCTAAPVGGDLGGHVYNFARNDCSERLRFYIKSSDFYQKKHDFLVLRHP